MATLDDKALGALHSKIRWGKPEVRRSSAAEISLPLGRRRERLA